ncbi:MAG: tetratricopeptide repeat protein [Bacteroidetes bacterium]|nr:tetratricopeptide repeat protein [Bacteroidota bacterium]
MKQKNKATDKTVKNPKQIPSSVSKIKSKYWIPAAILIVTIIVFSNTLNNDFTNWDDNKNVTENTDITSFSGNNIHAFFTNPYMGMYVPLTMISYAIDYKAGGLNPHIFHRTNLVLHLLNIVLVFFLLQLITGRIEITVIVTLLFAIHPMNSQTVAWISTRSTLLYAFFFLAALINYLYYLKKGYRWKFLILSLFLFFLSLLSKSQAMAFPLVLLLFDYFFSRKFNVKLLIEKAPFFALSVVFGIITLSFRGTDAVPDVIGYTFSEKVLFIPFSLVAYIFKSIAPVLLSAYHPYPVKASTGLPFEYYCAPFALLLFVWIIYKIKKYRKEILFGSLFFLCTIFLVLHVISINSGITAERYTYIPCIGLFYLIGRAYTGINDSRVTKINSIKPYIIIGLTVYILALCFVTRSRNEVWKDSVSLYDDVILKYPDAALAYNNRGVAKYKKKQIKDALKDYNKAIELSPKYSEAYNNRGNVYLEFKSYKAALDDYTKAIELWPAYSDAYYNRGNTKYEMRDYKGAIADYNKASEKKKYFAELYNNRGNAKIYSGDFKGAVDDFTCLMAFEPNNYNVYNNRANAKAGMKDLNGAMADFSRAIELNPNFSEAYSNRGFIKKDLNDHKGAIEDYNKAIELNPNLAYAYNNRGFSMMESGDLAGALNDINKSLSLASGNAEAYYNRGLVNQKMNKINEACNDWEKALQSGFSKAEEILKKYCR